jgi:hypothetical protein
MLNDRDRDRLKDLERQLEQQDQPGCANSSTVGQAADHAATWFLRRLLAC